MNKLYAALVIFIAGAGLGTFLTNHFTKPPAPQIVVQKVVEEGKTQTVVVEKIVTRTIKPDGTVIEKQTERQKDVKQETHASKETPKVVFQPKTEYSLDIRYAPALTRAPSAKDVEIEAGYRLGQSNAWLTTGYSVKYNQVTIGMRYEF